MRKIFPSGADLRDGGCGEQIGGWQKFICRNILWHANESLQSQRLVPHCVNIDVVVEHLLLSVWVVCVRRVIGLKVEVEG